MNLENKKIKIIGEKILLKKLSPRNATKEYCSWLDDPAINKWLVSRKTTIAKLREYIKEKNKNPDCLFLGIFLKDNQKHIGNIKLEPIDFKNHRAIMGILIGDKNCWSKGIGAEATNLLLDYVFKEFCLKEISLGVNSENQKAVNLYKKIGFKINCVEKKSIRQGDKLCDRLVMSIRK